MRSEAIDALRGLAILMMILSGSIPFGGALPGWMYHAQEPPPVHIFRPDIPGITWVDLVFPFFIFSMGAAIPFAISSRIKRGESNARILGYVTIRWIGLALFSFLIFYIRPWNISENTPLKWVICLFGFIALFAAYVNLPDSRIKTFEKHIHTGGYLSLITLLFILHVTERITFSLHSFDIIIMILSLISWAGGIIYLFAKRSTTFLIGTWAAVASFYLGAKLGGGWVPDVWNYSPASWLLSWEYVKYLLVLIPGIWAGNHLHNHFAQAEHSHKENKRILSVIIASISISINIIIVHGLYVRALVPVMIGSLVASILLMIVVHYWQSDIKPLIKKLLSTGILAVMSGLLAESLQGGIKKDPATFSYLVLTPGLALLMLVAFLILIDLKGMKQPFSLLTGSGKNAMFAYFAGSNLIIPVLMLTGIDSLFTSTLYPAFWLTLKAIIITLLVAWASYFMAKKKFMIRT
jgi:predicted acyltransferase